MALPTRTRPALALALTLALLQSRGATPRAAAGDVTIDGRTFTVPDGFTLQKVAGPPLVDRPIVADFDEQGRLYVADSSGSNDPVQKQLAEKPHRILRLEDSDGDGVFDRRTVFADRMMFPEGVMWLDGSVYVSAPPSIWKLTDADGDGVAETRVEWHQGKTLTGCANDLHGPYAGPDGWIYWAKGAFAEQTYPRPGKNPLVSRASHFLRARPDGSGLEPVMTGGMDNPVDMVFTPGGERVFSCTFFQHPGGGHRDGLIHAVYGGVYGKVHAVLDGHVRTGPEVLPVLAHLGPAAPCGLTTYEAPAFGPGYRDNIFACNFNLQKITRHAMTPKGAGFTTKDEDFLVGKFTDFHPTDVLDDADGSLLVVDTGGWYKLCCPTSVLWKPDVLGSIYRIRKAGAPKVEDPRGLALDWKAAPAELVKRLDDPRPAVRKRAVATLGKRGDAALTALAKAVKEGSTAEARRNAVWALTRIDGPAARAAAREALGDLDETVRQVAAHSASVRLDRDALPRLTALLLSGPSQNRRVAAEALGRFGDASAVPALLTAAGQVDPDDRMLDHSVLYALIEIGDPEATRLALKESQSPRVRRAALVALDQMGTGLLKPADVTPGLSSPDAATRETAWWVVGRHPEWGDALAGFLRERVNAKGLTDADRDDLAARLARFAGSPAVEAILAESLREGQPLPTRVLAARAMGLSGVKAVPRSWVEGLAAAVRPGDLDLARAAVAAARSLAPGVPKDQARAFAGELLRVGSDTAVPVPLRLEALAAVPDAQLKVNDAGFAFLRAQLDPENPVVVRGAAAGVLGRAALTREQLAGLTESVRNAGPMEMDRLLGAFEKSADEAVGKQLVAALKAARASASLRVDQLKPRLEKYPAAVRAEAESLYAKLNVDASQQKARIDALLPAVAAGDIRRGQEVFNGTKAACRTCHAIGYVGGQVGPDLSQIGRIRTERDLLESILYPSLTFVRSYEPVTVATTDGKVVNGVIKKDASDEVILAVNATEQARIARESIDDIRPGTVSVMPAGLDQQLSPQELADLVAFLKSRK